MELPEATTSKGTSIVQAFKSLGNNAEKTAIANIEVAKALQLRAQGLIQETKGYSQQQSMDVDLCC